MSVKKEFLHVNVSELIPYENNPRINEPAVADTMESIKQCENLDPIEVDEDFVILSGHTRLMAMQRLGIKETDIVRYTGLTDEQKKKYRILANKTNELAEWDFEKLEKEIADIDFSDFSFDFSVDNDDSQASETQETEPPEPPEEPRAKVGDLYQLGNHRLICGNSTDPAVIDRLMGGAKADMVFTDSPYGINIVNDKGKVGADNIAKCGSYNPVIGDDTTETAQQAYDIYSQLCDKMILWGGNYFLDFLPPSDSWLIWDKETTGNFADGEMAWCSFHTPVRIYHQLWNGMIREGEHEKRVHPTQKPIRMLSEILRDFTKEGDIILDVFGGSGSTLIACEQTGRTCYMAELSPEYVDVIIARWEKLTGNKAVLLT